MGSLRFYKYVFTLLVAVLGAAPTHAQQETRIALVIGNSAYPGGALATAANDAGLVAQTLQAAGFDVSGARDLDATTLRSSFREFVEKASAAGPDTVALVYFAGYGLQFEGENYLVPVDARLSRDSDVPLEAIRVNDLVKPLSSLTLKARIIVLDAGRTNKFAASGQPLAGGLALMQPDAGTLIAFNAAPGTVAPEATGAYGAFATALAEMIKAGGLPLEELFERVRLRVNEVTKGAELTWEASRVQVPFLFFERVATPPASEQDRFVDLRAKPIRGFSASDAYLASLARDTLHGYEDFLAVYSNDPLAKRVRAIIAARREATTWRESVLADSPDAYWSYLGRYPHGPHAYDAQRRLAHFAAALEPPPSFAAISYDVPPPPPEEIVFVERPYVYFADPAYDLPPPPLIPVIFLAPAPVYFLELPPPPPPIEAFVLPFPVYYPVPNWVERPSYVAAPPMTVVSVNIHNTVVLNPANHTVVVTNPTGQPVPPLPSAAPSASGLGQPANSNPSTFPPAHSSAAAAAAVALPAAAALRSRQVHPAALPGSPLAPGRIANPQPLPSGTQPVPGSAARQQRPGVPPAAAATGSHVLPVPPAPPLSSARRLERVPLGSQRPSTSAGSLPPPPPSHEQLSAQQRLQQRAAQQHQQQIMQQQAVQHQQQQIMQQRAAQQHQQQIMQQQAVQHQQQQIMQQRAAQQHQQQRQPACGRPGLPPCR
jgi:uncharacterized caspase-like protein